MINQLFWIVPVCSVIALAFAYMFFRGMMKESEGNETMKRIAGHVRKGAMAYLKQQYKVVGMVFLALCVFFAWMAYGPGLQNGWVWFAFLTGGFFSGLAHERGVEDCLSFGRSDGIGGCRACLVGYIFVVAGAGYFC